MTKMTIVADSKGKVVAAVMGHTLASKHGDIEAKVSFAQGHTLHKVEVEEEMAEGADPGTFLDKLGKYLPKS